MFIPPFDSVRLAMAQALSARLDADVCGLILRRVGEELAARRADYDAEANAFTVQAWDIMCDFDALYAEVAQVPNARVMIEYGEDKDIDQQLVDEWCDGIPVSRIGMWYECGDGLSMFTKDGRTWGRPRMVATHRRACA